MTYAVDTREKIHYLQNAIWKLEAAADLIETANGIRDPEIEHIRGIIFRLDVELDTLARQIT